MSPNVPVVPSDPQANKAVVAAFGTIVTVLLRWAVSGHFTLPDEGLVALAGAITTVAVYAVSNWRSVLKGKAGYTLIEIVVALFVIFLLIWLIVWLLPAHH